jgi:hypothetical protein
MELIEKIKKTVEEVEIKKQELIDELKPEFSNQFKPLFEKSEGKLQSFSWTQYTPYFNDGDECTFSVNVDKLDINGQDIYEIDSLREYISGIKITEENYQESVDFCNKLERPWWIRNIGESGYLPNPNFDEKLDNIINEITGILESIPEDFYKDLFGNHKQITIYSSGNMEIEDYDHD